MDLPVGKRDGNFEGYGAVQDGGGKKIAEKRGLGRRVGGTGRYWSWIKSGGLYLVSILYFFCVYFSLHLSVSFSVLSMFLA